VQGLESDRPWLDAFRRGDRAALARVFDTYAADVARTIRAGVVVKTPDGPLRVGAGLAEADVEALVQETFVKALSPQARMAYDGIRPFGAWLGTIARHVLIDHGRQRLGQRFADVPLDELADAGPSQEDVVANRELKGLLARFLAAIDELDRRVFTLRYVESRSRRDASEILGLSEMQVRRRDVRLKRDLVIYLHDHGVPVPAAADEDNP
jgi:RNA polymerase sigma-70 factor (ECF subfamily)